MEEMQPISLTHQQALDLLQILRMVHKVNAGKLGVEDDATTYAKQLLLLTIDNINTEDRTADKCQIQILDTMDRFGLWLTVDLYEDFLKNEGYDEDIEYIQVIKRALQPTQISMP